MHLPRSLLLLVVPLLGLVDHGTFAIPGRPPHWVQLATSLDGRIVAGAAYEDGCALGHLGGAG